MQKNRFYAKNLTSSTNHQHLISLVSCIAISSVLVGCQSIVQNTSQAKTQHVSNQVLVNQTNRSHLQPSSTQEFTPKPQQYNKQHSQNIQDSDSIYGNTLPIFSTQQLPEQSPIVTQTPEQKRQRINDALLKRAKSNNTTTSNHDSMNSVENIPAYHNLIAIGIKQLQSGQLAKAETSFTHAQRLSPQKASAYLLLGQIAMQRGEATKAEAMARRGLTVAKKTQIKQSLWQLILQSAQIRGDIKTMNEAKNALR